MSDPSLQPGDFCRPPDVGLGRAARPLPPDLSPCFGQKRGSIPDAVAPAARRPGLGGRPQEQRKFEGALARLQQDRRRRCRGARAWAAALVEPRGGVRVADHAGAVAKKGALGDGLKSNGSLQWLELENNSIGAAGAEAPGLGACCALADGLKSNGSLVWLDLNGNSIGDAGAEALADGLKSNGSLQTLWLQFNSIGDAGVQALADGLKSNGSLKELYLSSINNSIGDAGAEALAAGLRENRSLRRLRLGKSLRVTPGGQALLEAQKVKKERGEDFEIKWQLGFGSEKIGSDLRAVEGLAMLNPPMAWHGRKGWHRFWTSTKQDVLAIHLCIG
eukprot:s159_g32.t1